MTHESQLEEKLQRVSFATLGHFLEEGFVSHEVRSLLNNVKVFGRAATVKVANFSAYAINQALATLQENDVLIIDMQGDHQHACVGTVTACAAAAKGARAIVVDGVVTDILELRAAGLPIFARGTSLLTTKLNLESASELNVAVSCGGISVQPGDWVLGDDNGLLVLPAQSLLEVIDIALGSDEAEPDVLQRLRSKEPVERVLRLPHQAT